MTEEIYGEDELEDDGFEDDGFEEAITTVCFTGHRELPEERIEAIKNYLDLFISMLYDRGARTFKAGGAIGFDIMAEEAVLDFKRSGHDDIKLLLYLPAPDQAKNFPSELQKRYDEIKAQADEVFYSAQKSTTESYHARNRRLTEGSDVLVTYCTTAHGGSYYTCRDALKKGIELINIADFVDE